MEKFESVKQLKKSLNQKAQARGKIQTKSAWYHRIRVIREFTNFTGLNPDALIAEGVDAAMTRLTDYLTWLRGEKVEGIKPRGKPVSWNSAITYYANMRGFYTHNKIVFPNDFLSPRFKLSAVSKRDSLVPFYEYDEDKEESYMNELLPQFVSNLKFLDRTIVTCLLATGADAADLLALKVGFVRDPRGHFTSMSRIPWRGNRLKDGIEFRTYFSKEATACLKRYYEQERANAGDEESLFFTKNGRPLKLRGLRLNFRVVAKRMGYAKKGLMNPFRPKRFRHSFREACSAAGVDQGYVEAMMGHSSSMSATYLEKSGGSFLREYTLVEPYITLFGSTRKEATDLKETFSQEDETENDTLKQRIHKLEDDIRTLTESSIESNKTKNEREEKWVHELVYEESDLINRINDGWEIMRELKDGGFILRRYIVNVKKKKI